ncbi:MAG: YncE family protein [Dehalococcoidia bacterium]|nr:YncE family protein [Dehalococcoidia bacterium]
MDKAMTPPPTGFRNAWQWRALLVLLAASALLMTQIAAADTVLTPIPVGTKPVLAHLTLDHSKLWVSDATTAVSCPYPGGDISVISSATNAVIATVFVGVNPGPVGFTPDGSKAYVVNRSDCDPTGSVSVIVVPSSIPLVTVPVGESPVAVSVSADSAKVYVANRGTSSGSISVICTGLVPGVCSATDTVISTIALDPFLAVHPRFLAMKPDGSELWVAEEDCPALVGCTSSNIAVISTSTDAVSTNISVGPKAGPIQFTADGSRAYVLTEGDSSLSIPPAAVDINASTHAVTNTIAITPPGFPTGASPQALSITPEKAKVYVVNKDADDVAVICTGMVPVVCSATDSVLTYIPVGNAPTAIEVTDTGGRAYVVNGEPLLSAGTVSVICTGLVPCGGPAADTVMSTLTVGNLPVDVAINCSTNTAYVPNLRSSDVSVISLSGSAICGIADSDRDTVVDSIDNCPDWPNTAQNLPLWTVPAGDRDCDGFTGTLEVFMGTYPDLACGATAWPPDINDNLNVGLSDVLAYIPLFNTAAPGPPYQARYDLNGDGADNLPDILRFIPYFGKTCTP